MSIEDKVQLWITIASELKKIKEDEFAIRKEICEHILEGKIKGSKKGTIGKFVLNATAVINNKLDKELLESIWPDLSDEEKASVKYTPSLVAAEYKRLPDNTLLNRAVDSKPGTPCLELKEVKPNPYPNMPGK